MLRCETQKLEPLMVPSDGPVLVTAKTSWRIPPTLTHSNLNPQNYNC